MKRIAVAAIAALTAAYLPVAGCSNDNDVSPPVKHDASASDATNGCTAAPSTGLRPFCPPDRSKLGAGQLLLTASGESLAQLGYSFPDTPSHGVFADGWEVRFAHFIATFDHVVVSSNPDKVPTDQSQTDEAVARADGPWAIDLSKATADDVAGKEQGETATPFAVIANQNLNGNAPFATDGTKYAVGFSSVVASANAINVNLDSEGLALYEEMIAAGCSVLYDGIATFKANPSDCTTQDPELDRLPKQVHFHLCFKSPTDYLNCDNQDIQGRSWGDEPHPRGIVFPNNTYVTGEITFHTDHPFWESVVHDVPPHFDPFAARVANAASDAGALDAGALDGGASDGGEAGIPTVTMDSLVGADYLAYTDQNGNPIPWRSCVKSGGGQPYGKSSGRMMFDPGSVPKAPPGPSPTQAGLRDYYDFVTYNQSTQGHWNGADGLCFVRRNYSSPN